LIIDEVKSISVEEIESQMLDTTNIVTTLDELELAPQTKQFMRWAETGTVEKVFLLPGRPTPARSLFRVTENDQNVISHFHVFIYLNAGSIHFLII